MRLFSLRLSCLCPGGMIVLLLALLLLQGCALSRDRVRRAEAVIQAQVDRKDHCGSADHCASDTPLRRLIDQAGAGSSDTAPVHFANILDRGAESLALRIHLIRSARASIDTQTFIFSQDDAGYLVLDELIKAARRGVRVRILADQLFSLGDSTLLSQVAGAHVNLEIRLYNPAFDKAATPPLEFAANLLCCFFQFNQRMHNKLLLVDGVIGIAGGRNYENRYFDWDEAYDYRDRDVMVTGPVAGRQMLQSFELFWVHPRTRTMAQLKDVNRRLLSDSPLPGAWAPPAWENAPRVEALSAKADDTAWISQAFVDTAFRVGTVDYFSDSPNKPIQPDNHADQELTRRIITLLKGAQQEIIVQTPYLVISRPARRVFRELHESNPQLRVVVSTNSLAATDAFYVYALYHKYRKRYIKRFGFEIFEFRPFPAHAPELVADYARLSGRDGDTGRGRFDPAPVKRGGVRMGIHAKSFVIDGRISLIGSHNFDPRSDNYNTESGFIIADEAFSTALRASILRDTEPGNSWTVAKRPRPRLVEGVNDAIADLSAALPVFDIWPFRYATSFELKPGCQPLRSTDPRFYECYEPVGDFPEVALPLKSIYTRIVTAFGAGLVGIL
ncbi:phospholipase D family protein [Tahibacter amnicola]|uniref:Phospholipase D family protein n=1 Tax=Tahibacter amnicola TaxID=2976241 RepID=A0ABY6BFD4_9GAMM|nr:phospholipase D family protein [Tahibacter amnicola]UXI68469.1 phospholipase D family protein [Tahibacter amnicola]